MKPYHETKKSYDASIDWHIQKSLSYDWSSQIGRFLDGFAGGVQGKKVLDAGCCGGRDIAEFLKRGLHVDGLDYSGETIKRCRKQFPKTRFFVGDMTNMDLPDESYDGLWACASLLHIEKDEIPLALSEFKRVLKKHGALFISVKMGKGEGMIPDDAGGIIPRETAGGIPQKSGCRFFCFFSADELKKFAEEAGFMITRIETVPDSQLAGKAPKQGKNDWICLFAVKN